MISIDIFIKQFPLAFTQQNNMQPWEITSNLGSILTDMILHLNDDYKITDGVAIHKTAVIETGVILKAPVIVGAHCFIGSNVCLRGGVYLAENAKVGTGCEVKTSVICSNSAIAHFNFIGDSIIGSNVNFEAGSITANHFNERKDKLIRVVYNGQLIETGAIKFGSLVGDDAKIGANAVLSPGTLLEPGSIVKRLELIDQVATAGR